MDFRVRRKQWAIAARDETALPSIEDPDLDELAAAAMGRDPSRSEVIAGSSD
jgi:hypothetical protein